MQFKRLRRVLKKRVKQQQQQAEDLSLAAERGIERLVFRRFSRLRPVRRFVIGWITLMLLMIGCLIAQFVHLSSYYQHIQAVPGGIYTEGITGSISNVNPMYATSDVDRSLSRLLFAGLLKYGTNGKLTPALASNYQVGDNGKLYTIKLKPNLTWHDGKPLTSQDIVYTFNAIKDPDARSPLFSTWQNITVTAVNPTTVTFTLPSALATFPHYLTTGIVPQHILGKTPAVNLRSANFNTIAPVGAGPFKWHGLQVTGNDPSDAEQQVALVPFQDYAGGKPLLNEFIVRSFASEDGLKEAFASGQLMAAAGLQSIPEGSADSTVQNNMLLTAGTYVFFKTTTEPFTSVKVRQALAAATMPQEIINSLGYMTRPVDEPLLGGQLGYDKKYAQKTNDKEAAKQLLAEDGWQAGSNGVLQKNGKQLTFKLVVTDTPEYRRVSQQLARQWQTIGVKPIVQLVSQSDYATVLAGHDYDATLHGIAIGEDPDVYAYWDSSQADVRSNTRLNLSEWKNTSADSALESGRTRLDPQLRVIKYAPFLQAWQQEAPAIGLYQPRYLYLTRSKVYGLTNHGINSGINRFNGVENWQIRTARVNEQ